MDGHHTEDESRLRVEERAVGAGVAAGTLAALAMGVVLQGGTDLMPVLGTFAGAPSVLRGWLVHLLIGVAYGALFAAIVGYPPVREFLADFDVPGYVLVGVTYATMIAALSIAILPFVFELPWVAPGVGTDVAATGGPAVAGLLPAGAFALAHLVYGAVLGGVYAALRGTGE